MKKYSIYLCLALLIGLFSSCSQDDNDALSADAGNLVSFTATLPADWAPATTIRAVPAAPASHQLRCILEIWTKDLSVLKVRKELPATGTGDLTFTFELGEMGEYKALLWADYIDAGASATTATIAGLAGVDHYPDKYYTTDGASGLQAVQLIAGAATPCELRDGFFGSTDFTKNALPLRDLSVTLTRPFAKLTIAEKDNNIYNYCDKVVATYTVPKQFNVANGTSKGTYNNTRVSFTPDHSTVEVNGQMCHVLFSDYVLADADGTMSEINLTYTPNAAGDGIVFRPFNIPAGVTLQRNKVTQAAGYIIAPETTPSPTVEMTVDVNDQWNTGDGINLGPKVGDYYYKDGTWSEKDKSTQGNPILGVIYSFDGDYAYVVSKTQGKSLAWSTENVDLTLSNNNDGKTNTNEILEYATSNGKLDSYPIFKACQELRDETGLQWYIHALPYSNKVFGVMDQINPRIRDIGGDEIGLPVWLSGQAANNWGRLQVTAAGGQGTDKSEQHDVIFVLDFKYK